jgi:hypothetical protein
MYILTINKGGGGIYFNKSAIRVAKKAYYMVIYQLHITLNNIFNYCSKYLPNHKTITLSKAAMLHYYFWGSLRDPEVN